jgi:hypothetical protein
MVMGLLVEALDRRFLDRLVHSLGLAIIRHDDPDAQIPGRLLFDGAMVRPSGHGASGARECGQADP